MCCSASKPSESKAIALENRGQISDFLPPVKLGERLAKCLNICLKFTLEVMTQPLIYFCWGACVLHIEVTTFRTFVKKQNIIKYNHIYRIRIVSLIIAEHFVQKYVFVSDRLQFSSGFVFQPDSVTRAAENFRQEQRAAEDYWDGSIPFIKTRDVTDCVKQRTLSWRKRNHFIYVVET